MNLFTPLKIKDIEIKNRVVLPPLVRFSIVGIDGYVTKELLEWYEDVAKGGVGLIIVEATCVSENGRLRENQLGIWDDTFIDGLSEVAKIGKKYGVPMLLQIHHAGFKDKISIVEEKVLDDILIKFEKAFVRAKKAGFDGIEIHAAHRYLISQLHSRIWNKREDKYGGSLKKRMYFIEELIDRTKYLFDNEFILGCRIGGNEPHLEDGIEIAKRLERKGIDLLHISSGVPDPNYKQEVKIDLPKDFKFDWVVYLGTEIKKHINIPVIGVRNIKTEEQASYLVENNMLDLVAVGRAMISRPNWTNLAKREYLKRKEKIKTLDIFCDIIDNYGDIGVVYRIAKELKRIHSDVGIRVFLNRVDEFLEINSKAQKVDKQTIDGITYMTNEFLEKNICTISPANVIIEAFGCTIFKEYLEKAKNESSLLINLEYLSGEEWAETAHLMESPTGAKMKKFFFMPGFNENTGGVIVDSLFLDRKKRVKDDLEVYRKKYIKNYRSDEFIGTIFTYEKNFTPLIESLILDGRKTRLLIMGEKSKKSFGNIKEFSKIEENLYEYKNITIQYMEFLNQEEYEEVINISDFNLVRGEDSFVRSLLVGAPFVWHIYLQEEMAHMDKIDGFLRCFKQFVKKNNNATNTINTLLRDYNFRKENSFEVGKESFVDFFKYFDEIKKISEDYAEYLIFKCNLIDKLNNFIINYQEVKL